MIDNCEIFTRWHAGRSKNEIAGSRGLSRNTVPARRVGGLILVGEPAGPEPAGETAVYARVSSADQRADLDRQVARVATWAAGEGLAVGRVVTEVGPALNGRRRKFPGLLRDQAVTTIVVEHRDRFARSGAGYAEAALAAMETADA